MVVVVVAVPLVEQVGGKGVARRGLDRILCRSVFLVVVVVVVVLVIGQVGGNGVARHGLDRILCRSAVDVVVVVVVVVAFLVVLAGQVKG